MRALRTLLTGLLGVLCLVQMGWATGPAVRQATTGAGGDTTTAVAYAANVVAGNALFLGTLNSTNTATISSVTDSQTNTWTSVASYTVDAIAGAFYRATAGSSAANTVTVVSSAGVARVWLLEIAGLSSVSNGGSATNNDTTSGDPLTMAPLAVTCEGIALSVIRADTAMTVEGFFEGLLGNTQGVWSGLTGSSQAAAAFRTLSGASETIAPLLDPATTETGDSATAAICGTWGGGARSSTFVSLQFMPRWSVLTRGQ